jgi:hypothetical protein
MADSFLHNFATLNEGTEIPSTFALWCGLAGLSCALGRRCWVQMGNVFTIYPNMYTVLVAASGVQRKSTAVGMIERVVRQLSPTPNIIAQKITPEGLIDAIRTTPIDVAGKALLRQTCEGFVIVDELDTFLNKNSYEAGLASLLIQLYDCKESFEYRTKGRGSEKATNTCLGILGASTIDWIRRAIPADAVGGGLTSRMLFVYDDVKQPGVALPVITSEQKALGETCARQLQEVASLSGEYILLPEAAEYFTRSYDRFRDNSDMWNDGTMAGYASRRGTHMLKLGMLLSASAGNSMAITREYMEAAELLLEGVEKHLPAVMRLITSTDEGAITQEVSLRIRRAGSQGISRAQLSRAFSHKVSANHLSDLLQTSIESHEIRMEVVNGIVMYWAI